MKKSYFWRKIFLKISKACVIIPLAEESPRHLGWRPNPVQRAVCLFLEVCHNCENYSKNNVIITLLFIIYVISTVQALVIRLENNGRRFTHQHLGKGIFLFWSRYFYFNVAMAVEIGIMKHFNCFLGTLGRLKRYCRIARGLLCFSIQKQENALSA